MNDLALRRALHQAKSDLELAHGDVFRHQLNGSSAEMAEWRRREAEASRRYERLLLTVDSPLAAALKLRKEWFFGVPASL